MRLLLVLLILLELLHSDINLIKQENSDSNTTLLVIGGIHGDEPGGYFAASLLASHYKITSKNLWIVPNLNQDSVIANKRGINGDMNRKFASIKSKDKDKKIVDDIKKIILEKNISLILNLHDGHGFYREKYQSTVFNPNAWGQTCVIDQCKLKEDQEFGNLNEIASIVRENLNKKLLQKHHSFAVKNTNTKFDDEAMQLSLTYYAVTNNKPAFALESSKNLSTLAEKVFYQLLAIEEFMKIMDITYIRNFEFTQKGIAQILQDYGTLKINGNILLNFSDIKKSLSYIPLKSKSNDFTFTHPLGQVKKSNGDFVVYIGNKHITTLKPQYFKMSQNCPNKLGLVIDGESTFIQKASAFYVNDDFKVSKAKNLRVNIIGYRKKGILQESDIDINLENLSHKFSLDNANKVYRIEFYKNDEFCSMSMVHFK